MSYEPRSGNALVPSNAPIQPAQAFVDNIAALIDGTGTTLNLSNKGLTSVSGAVIVNWLKNSFAQNASTPTVNLSGNALSAASVNGVLQSVAVDSTALAMDAIFDLSGGTSSGPTDHQDAIITLNLTGLILPAPFATDIRSGRVGQGMDWESMFFHVGTEEPAGFDVFANTRFDPTLINVESVIFVGAGDPVQPTISQIITRLVSLGGGEITDIGSNTIRIVLSSDKIFDYNINATETLISHGIVGTVVQAGNKSAKSKLIDAGSTVTTN